MDSWSTRKGACAHDEVSFGVVARRRFARGFARSARGSKCAASNDRRLHPGGDARLDGRRQLLGARVTQQRLQETYPNLRIVLVTANDAASQVNDLEDLYAIHNIDALVILPFESEPLTDPVEHLKNLGVFVTVVDRGLTRDGIADIYVAGNNPAMGASG